MPEEIKEQRFLNQFVRITTNFGNLIYFKAIRKAFSALTPVLVLIGLAALIEKGLLPLWMNGQVLEATQSRIVSSINLLSGLIGFILAGLCAFFLTESRGAGKSLLSVILALAVFIVLLPGDSGYHFPRIIRTITDCTGGITGILYGTIVGLLSAGIFIALCRVVEKRTVFLEQRLQLLLNLIWMAVSIIAVFTLFRVAGDWLETVFGTEWIIVLNSWIAYPLDSFFSSILVVCLFFGLGNLIYCFGIDPTAITGTLTVPFLIVNVFANMMSYVNGQTAGHIVNLSFVSQFGMIGGCGSTLCLILALLLFGRRDTSRKLAKQNCRRGLFNINQPLLFGMPVVFNMALVVPFTIVPVIGMLAAWLATALGWMNVCTIAIPAVTPPLLGVWLATAGDWRAVIVQLVVIAAGTLIYRPFIGKSDQAQIKSAQAFKRSRSRQK
ncbi:MAG: PTS transporter subunit EIIC [Eubacteriaceae bacterium]|jgi:PTS system cellobiose-specific IIC component